MTMEQQGNPFAAPVGHPFNAAPSVAHDTPKTAGGNPFDPFVAKPGVQVIQPANSANPFGVVSQQPLQQALVPLPYQQQLQPQPQVPQQQPAYAQTPPFGTPASPQHQPVQPTHPLQQPYAAPFPSESPFDAYSGALVAVQQPSNPYAGLVAPQGNPFEQAIVPLASPQPANQWGLTPAQPANANPFSQGTSHPPPHPIAQQQHYALQQPDPSMMIVVTHQAPPPQYPPQPDTISFAQQPPEGQMVPYEERPVDNQGAIVVRQDDFGTDLVPGGLQEVPPESPVNKYSQLLAQNAPAGAAPLPKGDLIVKSGFVLSRISFRTIMMKKWKQCFWVQYGPHTMLWFRSHADFNDWLNNPYLTQNQRNYLIKLAVNFVHDLYKPNVRGYQVTQPRSKAYGRKVLKQFKLERWMDYGPTIAAAFASQNIAEVDVLRETLVECMRNTPLSEGIRATGAVRQRPDDYHERGDDPRSFRSDDSQQSYYQPRGPHRNDEPTYQTYGQEGVPATVEAPPPPAVADLLSGNDADDVSISNYSQGPGFYGLNGYEPAPQGYTPQHAPQQQGYPPHQQQGYPPQQQGIPPQQQGYPSQGFPPQQVQAPQQAYAPQQQYGQPMPPQYQQF